MTTKNIQKYLLLAVLIFLVLSIILAFAPLPIMVLTTQGSFLLLAILYPVIKKRSIMEHLRLRSAPLRAFLLMAAVILLYIPVASFLTISSMAMYNALGFKPIVMPDLTSTFTPLVSLLLFSLTPGICEEVFFRGTLLSAYERPLSRTQALLWSSIFFGVIHFSPYNLLSPIALGLIFGLFTLKYNSIFPAIFGHAFFNSSVLLVELIEPYMDIDPSDTLDPAAVNIVDVVSVLPIALIALALIYLIFRKMNIFKPLQVVVPEYQIIERPADFDFAEESDPLILEEKPRGRRPLGHFFIFSVIILVLLYILLFIPTQMNLPEVELVVRSLT